MVYLSACADITKYHRLGGLHNRNLFSHSSGGWDTHRDASQSGFWWSLSSWLANGHFLAMSSHGGIRERERERERGRRRECSVVSSYKDTNHIESGSTLMISFNLKYLLIRSIFKYSHIGYQDFNVWILGVHNSVHSTWHTESGDSGCIWWIGHRVSHRVDLTFKWGVHLVFKFQNHDILA